MNTKWTIAILIVLIALFVLIFAYMDANQDVTDHSGKTMSFNVSSGSSELSKAIDNIKTLPYYKGYNAETVKWMESLGSKRIFFGNDSVVIMDSSDAEKIPPEPGITDVYVYEHFRAEVVENHDFCDKYPTAYYVKNVSYTGQEIIGNGLA